MNKNIPKDILDRANELYRNFPESSDEIIMSKKDYILGSMDEREDVISIIKWLLNDCLNSKWWKYEGHELSDKQLHTYWLNNVKGK